MARIENGVILAAVALGRADALDAAVVMTASSRLPSFQSGPWAGEVCARSRQRSRDRTAQRAVGVGHVSGMVIPGAGTRSARVTPSSVAR